MDIGGISFACMKADDLVEVVEVPDEEATYGAVGNRAGISCEEI